MSPKSFKVKIQDKEYDCKPLRMSHRMIIMKTRPLFEAIEALAEGKESALSSEDILKLEGDLDTLIGSLIPELKNITLDIEDIASVLEQMMDSILPEDAKELKEAKVEVKNDPKVPIAQETSTS